MSNIYLIIEDIYNNVIKEKIKFNLVSGITITNFSTNMNNYCLCITDELSIRIYYIKNGIKTYIAYYDSLIDVNNIITNISKVNGFIRKLYMMCLQDDGLLGVFYFNMKSFDSINYLVFFVYYYSILQHQIAIHLQILMLLPD